VRDPESRRLLEAPQALWMRVAMGLSLVERDSRHSRPYWRRRA